jgi:predicted  nucleic acid-binding Zn-ribbon protein
MNADLEQLIVLQAQDLELKRLRQELAEAPRRVLAAQTARAQAEFAQTSARQSLAKEETLRRSAEVDIAERRGKIVRLRKQMETATSAAQITALEHEIGFAEQAIAKLEDEELFSLERSDQMEATRAAAGASLEATTAALAATRAASAELTTRNTAAVGVTEAERATVREGLAATDTGAAALSVYDRIAKAKGTGVSEAVDHKCTACQMMVRPQRWNDLVGHEYDHTIFTCETCGRMLYYDPRRDAPGGWAAGERLNTAAGTGPKPTASATAPAKVAESA